MLNSTDIGVRRKDRARARFTPGFAEGRSSTRTLKSARRALNGSYSNSRPTRRCTSRWNFGICSAVYPSLMTSRSTFCDGGPFSKTVHSFPAAGRSAGFTKRDSGSIDRRPDLAERVLGVALLQHDLHRRLRPRKAQRLGERAMQRLVLGGRFPFAVDRCEAA